MYVGKCPHCDTAILKQKLKVERDVVTVLGGVVVISCPHCGKILGVHADPGDLADRVASEVGQSVRG